MSDKELEMEELEDRILALQKEVATQVGEAHTLQEEVDMLKTTLADYLVEVANEVRALQEETGKLTTALEFYAQHKHIKSFATKGILDQAWTSFDIDKVETGQVAREALSTEPSKQWT